MCDIRDQSLPFNLSPTFYILHLIPSNFQTIIVRLIICLWIPSVSETWTLPGEQCLCRGYYVSAVRSSPLTQSLPFNLFQPFMVSILPWGYVTVVRDLKTLRFGYSPIRFFKTQTLVQYSPDPHFANLFTFCSSTEYFVSIQTI